MRKPRITVLGGTGFVGRHLVERLRRHASEIRVLTRNRDSRRELSVLPNVQLRNCDVHEPAALRAALVDSDVVINLVGILNESGRSGRGFERAHTELTRTLLASMKTMGISRLLQMSALQAGAGESHYLRTRGEAETLVRNSGLDWTLYRPSVIFGVGDGLYTRFSGLLKLLPGPLPLPLAHARTRFQPVYVGDVVEAMARTLGDNKAIGQTYELAGPQTFTLADIVRYTGSLSGRTVRVLPVPDLLGRLQGWMFDFLPAALKPYSGDNDRSLRLDSISTRQDLADLGIVPTPVDTIVPSYLGGSGKQHRLDVLRSRGEN
jgi:NADH dehydrogenase